MANSVSLLGSFIPKSLIGRLSSYTTIKVWLDPDKKMESVKAARYIRAVTGRNVDVIFTDKKPKEYQAVEELRQIIFK